MRNPNHLLERSGTFYLNRKIPKKYQNYDSRKWVRFSLKTDSKQKAVKQAALENLKLEMYWESLIKSGTKHSHEYYKHAVERAAIIGFDYLTNQQIAEKPLVEIQHRLNEANRNLDEKRVESIMGTAPVPIIMLSDLLNIYFDLADDIKIHKSVNQIRKWQNPRKRAIKNFIKCISDKNILELKKDDFLRFRNWWLARITEEELSASSGNKDFIHLKVVLKTIKKNYKLNIDLQYFFEDIMFEEHKIPRPSFTTDYILDVLLNESNLKGMNCDYKDMLFVMAETGVSFSEQTGILREDIILDCAIPHLIIRPRKKKKLKTRYRERIMPLVGYALEVFTRNRNGFPHLNDQADNISSAVGKYLRENNLFPSDKHSVYSLRHSFQNRLMSVKAIDRIQAELMGHKFQREKYGEVSIEDKYETMLQIQLKRD